jgi:hypothetical protein
MQHLETLAGRLHITLHYAQEKGECRVCAVNIHSNRLRLRSQFFTGRPVETVPKLVGLLFSLCGTAQSVASARACEQALGQTPDPETERQRDLQVKAETLFEHLLRLSQDWPKALGIEPLPATALQPLLTLKRDPQSALPLVGKWIDQNLTPKLETLQTRIQQNGWERLGDHPLQTLPDLPDEWWKSRLTATDAETFMAMPDVDGQACETSALPRQWNKPELQPWKAAYGNGLLTRLQARVLDMRECLEENPPQSPFFKGGSEEARQSHKVPPFEKGGTGGISLLQTPRGLLVHRITQQNGLIQNYQIVAPTEWNFHPHGSLQKMLTTLTGKDETDLAQQARILITALDPCVDYQLELVPNA